MYKITVDAESLKLFIYPAYSFDFSLIWTGLSINWQWTAKKQFTFIFTIKLGFTVMLIINLQFSYIFSWMTKKTTLHQFQNIISLCCIGYISFSKKNFKSTDVSISYVVLYAEKAFQVCVIYFNNILHLKHQVIPFVLQFLSCIPQVPDFSSKWRYTWNCVCYSLRFNVNTAYLLSLTSGTPRSTTDCIQIRSSCKLQPGERVCQRGPSHFSSVSRRYALYPMAKGSPRLATATLRPSMPKLLVNSDRQVYVPVLIR